MNEIAVGEKTATEGLLWLMRGLDFTCKALQASQGNPDLALSDSFKKSYAETLEKYHNFFVKKAIGVRSLQCHWYHFTNAISALYSDSLERLSKPRSSLYKAEGGS